MIFRSDRLGQFVVSYDENTIFIPNIDKNRMFSVNLDYPFKVFLIVLSILNLIKRFLIISDDLASLATL